jgi:hypothetical protein
MSFLDDIIDVGSSVWSAITGPGVGAGIARASALGYMLKEVTASVNKDNQKPETATKNTPDYGVREQVDPDTQHAIPVVYGSAVLGGIVTDAVLSSDNKTMWYCITICEKTGNLLGGTPSVITFERIYWDQNEIIFGTDGITAASFRSEDGVSSDNPNGLVEIYCFNGGSNSPVPPLGYPTGGLYNAWELFPNWTSNHTMDDLVFALIKVEYNREKGITGIGNIEFKLKNSMTDPGDVINDYLTNSRYGAGIPAEEINA